MVALRADGSAAGWLKLTVESAMTKLYDQRLYRGLSCFAGERDGVLTIGCFLVDSRLRRRGVARELLRAAVREARSIGARAIEAFPRRAEAISDGELWLGPYPLFVAEGFAVVNDFGPYPVLRLNL
jgi:GNAT superfamily N-acetyltransferase